MRKIRKNHLSPLGIRHSAGMDETRFLLSPAVSPSAAPFLPAEDLFRISIQVC